MANQVILLRVCRFYYHMGCVNPPLLAKPAKGYSWVCQPCGHGAGPEPAPTGIKAAWVAKANLKGKEREAPPQYDTPDAFYRGWNFRYFGWVSARLEGLRRSR